MSRRAGLGKNGIDQHHIIPKKFADHPVMKHVGKSRSANGLSSQGIHSRSNLVSLPRRSAVGKGFQGFRTAKGGKSSFHASRTQHKAHPQYNSRIEQQLDDIQKLPEHQWGPKVRALQNQYRMEFKSGKLAL